MSSERFLSGPRAFRLFGVLAVYVGASWLVLHVADGLRTALDLPPWIYPVTFLLLLVGLVVVMTTAWVQFSPAPPGAQLPEPWELALAELAASLRQGRVPHPTWPRALLGVVIAFSLLVGAAGGYVLRRELAADTAAPPVVGDSPGPDVAVLPFEVEGAHLEPWREGMAELVALGLDGAGGVRAIDLRAVLARYRERVPEGTEPSPATLLEVATDAGAGLAVVGALAGTGSAVRVAAEVRDARDGRELERIVLEGPGVLDSLPVLAERLAERVLAALLPETRPVAPAFGAIPETGTRSFLALRYWLEGRALYRRGANDLAIRAYERAAAADSGFGLAWYGLAFARRGEERWDALMLERALAGGLPPRAAALARAALDVERFLPRAEDSVRAAVARYRHDPEAWHLQGEMYFRGLVPGGPERARQAFDRATRLDPDFVPSSLRLAELSFLHDPDSASAATAVEAHARGAPGGLEDRSLRLAHTVAFGESARFAEALDTLETADAGFVLGVTERLDHPLFWPRRERLLGIVYRRGDRATKAKALETLLLGRAVHRGRLGEALALLSDRHVSELVRTCRVYEVHSLTGGVPSAVLGAQLLRAQARAYLAGSQTERAERLVCLAQFAADQGRWTDYEGLKAEHAALAFPARAAGDSVAARQIEAMDRWLDGWKLWRRGFTSEALGRFRSARADGAPVLRRPVGRLWMGRLLLDAGEPHEALAYFRSGGAGPLAALHVARTLQALGDPRAAEAYAFFLRWWGDADAAVRGLVEGAREALEQLEARVAAPTPNAADPGAAAVERAGAPSGYQRPAPDSDSPGGRGGG